MPSPSWMNKAPEKIVAVHRCRFPDPSIYAVTSLATTSSSWDSRNLFRWSSPERGILAVGRANGDVEIMAWHGKQTWVLVNTLPGPLGSRAENLVFSHQTCLSPDDLSLFSENEQSALIKSLTKTPPRLFSGSGGSEVWEWNWYGDNAGTVKATLPTQGGTLWCLAVNPSSTLLALGCDDGSVRLVSIIDGQFEHIRKFDQVPTRLLSIAWGPSNSENPKTPEQDSYIVTGCGDSSIRKWDIKLGRTVQKLTTDRLPSEHTLVWAVGILHDHTIVSGDSMGNVKFFDGVMHTQLQSIQAHEADCLCLTIAPDGKSVYTSGVDQKTSQIALVGARPNESNFLSEWIQTSKRRLHEHDVRALVISPSFMPSSSSTSSSKLLDIVPVLTSGGLDMSLSLITASVIPEQNWRNPVSNSSLAFDETQERRCTHVPQRSKVIHLSPEKRILACQRDSSFGFWSIPQTPSPSAFVTGDVSKGGTWTKLLEMKFNTHTIPLCSAYSPNGEWLALSDLYETKLFWLEWNKKERQYSSPLQMTSLLSQVLIDDENVKGVNEAHTTGSRFISFTSDSTRLILSLVHKSQVVVIQLGADLEVVQSFSLGHTRFLGARSIAGAASLSHSTAVSDSPKSDASTPNIDVDMDIDGKNEDLNESDEIGYTVAMAVSGDSQWLATADSANRLQIFNLDSLRHHTTLPTMPVLINALAFSPSSPSTLFVGMASNSFDVFSVETGRIDTRYSFLGDSHMCALREPLAGMSFVSQQNDSVETLVAWGTSWMSSIKAPTVESEENSSGKKRRHGEEEEMNVLKGKQVTGDNEDDEEEDDNDVPIRTTSKYKDVLCIDTLGPSELVIVERPYFSMLSSLPKAWTGRSRYGR